MNMNKPNKQALGYYNWSSVVKYFIDNKIWDEELQNDFWSELCNMTEIYNGSPFTITDWKLKHDNGKYSHLVSDCMKNAIPDLLEHFGEPDEKNVDAGILTATFIATW
jgi:hypothetical protein